MAYDFAGPWTGLSGHASQLFSPEKPANEFAKRSCQAGAQYLISNGVPGDKIVLGIPMFGRSFLGADNIGQAFAGHGGVQGVFPYHELPRPGSQVGFDDDVVAAYCVGGDGGFVSYDDPRTVCRKALFVKDMGLRGLFYWTAVDDTPQGGASLIRAGFAGLFSESHH